ncbi:MAG: hypothetical protein U1C53_01155 [Candidatus Veblenbacteria bacterium]|nr:hypothetical protein [Candidatus Veblenbacteria bacterium]MDZ4229722.1 hypothetical protein [Candidatus Veblenbacteria bacterium]
MNNYLRLVVGFFYLTAGGISLPQSIVFGIPTLESQQQEYLKVVKGFMLLDSTIAVSNRTICIVPGEGPGSPLELVPGLGDALLRAGYFIKRGTTPKLEALAIKLPYLTVDPRVIVGLGVRISRYCLEARKEGQDWVLRLEDYLAQKPRRLNCPLRMDTNSVVDILVRELSLEVPLIDWEEVLVEPPEYMVTLTGVRFDTATQSTLSRLADDGWRFNIKYGNYGGWGDYDYIYLSPTRLLELGQLYTERFVCLEFMRAVDSLRAEVLIDTEAVDVYGNLIVRNASYNRLLAKELVSYSPPFPVSEESDSIALSFDLGMLGYTGAVLSKMFVCPSVRKVQIDSSWPYELYAIPDVLASLDSVKVKEFLLGLADIEAYFGFPLGKVVRRLYVSNSGEVNAGFNHSDPSGVYAHIPILSQDSAHDSWIDVRMVGQHEAAHLVGHRLGLNRHRGLIGLHKMRPQESTASALFALGFKFFDELDESDFDPGRALFGGHSYEDPPEFIASYITSVVRPGWETIIQKKDAEFVRDYTTVTQVVRNIFRDLGLGGTAICNLLEQRLAWLREYQK